MKNIFLILVLATVFVACNEETTTSPSKKSVDNEASIVGNWQLSSLTQTNGQTLVDGKLVSTFTSSSSEENGTAQFTEEGNFGSNFGYKNSYTTSTSGSVGSYEEVIPAFATGGTFVHDKSANTIAFTTFNGEESNATITELSSTKLTYTLRLNRSETADGVTTTTTADVTTTFTK